jgi:hypothetical protein
MNNNYLDIWHLNSTWCLLGNVSAGDKLSIKGNLLTIEKHYPLLWIKRKINGDGRNDVYHLINDLFNMSEYHLREQNDIKKSVSNFKYNIIQGVIGLLNLRATYIDDVRFLSIFNSSLEKIKILKQFYVNENDLEHFHEIEKQIFIKNNKVGISSVPFNINNINNTSNNNVSNNNTSNNNILNNNNSNNNTSNNNILNNNNSNNNNVNKTNTQNKKNKY